MQSRQGSGLLQENNPTASREPYRPSVSIFPEPTKKLPTALAPQPHRPGGHFHLITKPILSCPEELVRKILLTCQNEDYPRVCGAYRLSPQRQQQRRDRKFYSSSSLARGWTLV